MPALSIVFSTYNEPRWLEWVLWGYAAQTFGDFEVIVADDGSGPETREVIDRLRPQLPYRLRHFWQRDRGYRKCRAMNRSILLAEADYLVFSDGDCIPRADFLAWHERLREPGRFLSGGYTKLPRELSLRITREDVLAGRAHDFRWLASHGFRTRSLKLKIRQNWFRAFCDRVTPTRPRFHGHNASAWKRDILAVNGWDERMQYGGQDLELGERLENLGIRGKTVRYSAVCVHLDHGRGYRTPEMLARNREIRRHTRRTRSRYTPHGIDRHQQAEPAVPGERPGPASPPRSQRPPVAHSR